MSHTNDHHGGKDEHPHHHHSKSEGMQSQNIISNIEASKGYYEEPFLMEG